MAPNKNLIAVILSLMSASLRLLDNETSLVDKITAQYASIHTHNTQRKTLSSRASVTIETILMHVYCHFLYYIINIR